MTLADIRDMLIAINPEVPAYHYIAKKEQGNYIVWAEYDEDKSEYANGKKTNQILKGMIVYFTKTEFDPVFDKIQEALNSARLSWSLAAVDFDENTKHIKFQWIFYINLRLE